MKLHIGKYEFDSQEQLDARIEALEEGHKHTIVKLGHIALTNPEYNEEGEETAEGVYSDKYHVDVLWRDLKGDAITEEVEGETIVTGYEDADHPYGWKGKAIDIDGEGSHAFLGLSYNELKF